MVEQRLDAIGEEQGMPPSLLDRAPGHLEAGRHPPRSEELLTEPWSEPGPSAATVEPVSEYSREEQRKPRVAVVFGGRSSEHAISCVTAANVLQAIDRDKYDVVPVGISTSGHWVLESGDPERLSITDGKLPEVDVTALPVLFGANRELVVSEPGQVPSTLGEVDVVFPLLHGPWGEDGTIQGLLEMSDIRYVGSGVLASAVGMDKHYMKVVFQAAGLEVTQYVVIRDRDWL